MAMPRKELLEKCPDEFESDLYDFLEDIYGKVNDSYERLNDISSIRDLDEISTVCDNLESLSKELY